ncbi:MAG TPA: thioredoxin-disulfide reductase [Bacilli bacterium]|nr:thioredoxin-disulfide reductase [Bacilli bacterium]
MFDVLIIGAGPAGMTAAIYAARGNLKVGIIEQGAPGGAMVNTSVIENYPGFKKIEGTSLALEMFEQVNDLGVEYFGYSVIDIEKNEDIFKVTVEGLAEKLESKALVIATGTKNKHLNIPGEETYKGKGISWCAICDGSFYKNKPVAVIGGGNSALEEALYLADIASKVYVIHRRDEFRGAEILVSKLKVRDNVEFILNTIPLEFLGEENLKQIKLQNKLSSEVFTIDVDGCFEYVGQQPANQLISKLEITDERGYVMVDKNFETSIKGLYACGDIVAKEIRQIATAINDGAIAALNIVKYCKE